MRTLICPHRAEILKVVDSPEVKAVAAVAGHLIGGLPGFLVNTMAVILVKRGIPMLCGRSLPRDTGV